MRHLIPALCLALLATACVDKDKSYGGGGYPNDGTPHGPEKGPPRPG